MAQRQKPAKQAYHHCIPALRIAQEPTLYPADMAGFLAYDLPIFGKRTPSQSSAPMANLFFSSSITVMAVVSDSHRCFPILLCFHRHHIAHIQLYQVNPEFCFYPSFYLQNKKRVQDIKATGITLIIGCTLHAKA